MLLPKGYASKLMDLAELAVVFKAGSVGGGARKATKPGLHYQISRLVGVYIVIDDKCDSGSARNSSLSSTLYRSACSVLASQYVS